MSEFNTRNVVLRVTWWKLRWGHLEAVHVKDFDQGARVRDVSQYMLQNASNFTTSTKNLCWTSEEIESTSPIEAYLDEWEPNPKS